MFKKLSAKLRGSTRSKKNVPEYDGKLWFYFIFGSLL